MSTFLLNLAEEQIDEIVIAQAEDDTAWEAPILVCRNIPPALTITPDQKPCNLLACRLSPFVVQCPKTTPAWEKKAG